MLGAIKRLGGARQGSVAPIVALSLVGLIAAGGLAVDFAQLANLDTELQNAADQSALAGVTQLDGQDGAMLRASAAARALVLNDTRFANDGNDDGQAATVANIYFYASSTDAENDDNRIEEGDEEDEVDPDSLAKFIRVDISARQARYAMTPIVGLVNSGNVAASAIAGLGSAICKTPPVMMCNPDEPADNDDEDYAFDADSYAGRGLRLVSVGNGNTAWAPGNFGYLDVNSSTSNPNVELREALGWTTPPGECSGLDGVQTRTGAGTPVTQALNTRFDIYEKPAVGNGNAASCPIGGMCPPSINVVKDLLRKGNAGGGNKCDAPKNGEWELPPTAARYLPDLDGSLAATRLTAMIANGTMGHPRDKCHAVSQNGNCTNGRIGNGVWDRDAYFRVNYGWTSTQWPGYIDDGLEPITTATPTRYQVYRWEIANRGTVIGGRTILANRLVGGTTNPPTPIDHDSPVCSQLQATPYGSGIVPGDANVDRRRISVAVLNCTANGVKGGGNTVYPVLDWIEMFLVEPSIQRDRTDVNDIYVEIIGRTRSGAGASAGQVVRRDKPYLVK
ncbi:hypothetical protein GGQ97_002427 [Sphingomonas kaistensis]|uniref:Putative Flp pilus-assembly TadG-like N-terminal domain-containing protein n=1 Tax=Sphingomonas kaistensis TaxID=298708 RepID=A0A7X5Y7M9_9SPHN|nr:Tad domain-containing protein [Sphingomonas kaistensis]NJC06634.1 hypothetical protein [Sphingomonas kaistensis]